MTGQEIESNTFAAQMAQYEIDSAYEKLLPEMNQKVIEERRVVIGDYH
ncbi:MAG: hypothetical protein QGF74_00705 [Candidatus Nanoarchaeia archaeon]|jgi:hypothetical protein|nr:hypothetical protein [Candidatus Nanoarchaeia archaeon]|tara:strand:- start:364 stop:507 length:144 start_codon:yes stop_codon:yes gene_type:complete